MRVPSGWEMALMRVWQEQYLRQSKDEFEKLSKCLTSGFMVPVGQKES